MIVDTLEQAWNGLINLLAVFITPDWGDAISWLPLLLIVGVIGPIFTIVALFWVWYAIRKPRTMPVYADPRRAAPLDASGNPVYPAGEPYSPTERLIYEPGATRSLSGETLLVACPKCALVRNADVDTCGNCGLSFTLKPTTRSLQPAGPPPGGAAAA